MQDNQNKSPAESAASVRLNELTGVVRKLCHAESIGRIYSVGHLKAQAALQAAFEALVPVLGRSSGMLVMSIAEGRIVIDGMAIEDRNPAVARFIGAFGQIHVDNLVFSTGLSYKEFEEFYRVLLQGAKIINSQGGLRAVLSEKGVEHIQAQEANYVLVRKEEASSSTGTPALPSQYDDEQLIHYMARQVLKKTDQRDWLIAEVKKDPKHMADFIAEGIEMASSRVESKLTPDQTIYGLLDNLRFIGQTLTDGKPQAEVDETTLQQAILTLEAEVYARSKKLTASETTASFVKEALAVITLYADEVRARKIVQELQRPKHNPRAVEKLLRQLTPEGMTPVACLENIRHLLQQQGINAEKLQKLASAVGTTLPRRPRARKPVLETISGHLRENGVPDEKNSVLTTKIGEYFDRELNARTGELKDDNRRLMDEVRDLNRVLDQMDLSVVCWNSYGVVTFVHHSAVRMLGLVAGCSLSAVAHDCLKTLEFPLTSPDSTLAAYRGLTERDTILLRAVEKLITGPDGTRIAAMLRRA